MNHLLRIIILIVVLASGALLNSVHAQISLGITGGVASRWAIPKNPEAIGFGYTASANYKFSNRWAAGVNFSSFHFGPEEKQTSNVDYKIAYYAYTGLVEYHFSGARFKPYAGIDFGLYNYYTVTTIEFDQAGQQKQVLDKNYFGFAPAVGANYSLAKNLLLNGNLKFNTVIIQQGAPIGYVALSVGIFYAFNQ